jgi:hypothetical protein
MIVRDGLHGLLDELVPFILEALAVSVFSSVDTATVVIVLRRRRGGSVRWINLENVEARRLQQQEGNNNENNNGKTYLSPSAGTTSLILSFWLISSILRCSV